MTKSEELKVINKRWVRAALALIFLGTAYGFASLAIDSGSLLEYALAIFFLVWAVKSAAQSLRNH